MTIGPGPRVALLVFVTSLGSSAYFWQARDWNVSSRLMLTYALVDRGTVTINGLEDHTRDRARLGARYYSDKLPGFSFLAVGPYVFERTVLGLSAHPLNVSGQGFTHWPADYGVTLGTSGLATALTSALLAQLAVVLGCGPRRAGLVGLSYALATPAFVYATLAYGHQVTAFALMGAFWWIWRPGRFPGASSFGAGFLAALAAVVELQVAPVSAVLGTYLLVLVLVRQRPVRVVPWFGLGAVVPLVALLIYNVIAFGSPFDMGYFHEDIAQFRDVHSKANPLGLRSPDWSKALPLLWGGHRGLLYYAPILALALPGWVVLGFKRAWGPLLVSLAACVVVFLVNLSYPEWTGGWSTGPRLLLPLLPFAMVPVAAAVSVGGRLVTMIALVLAVWGGAFMLMFQGVGGRVPQDIANPLVEFVWPAWSGGRLPFSPNGERFARNLVSIAAPDWSGKLPDVWQSAQFLPLVLFQAVMIVLLIRIGRARPFEPSEPA